MASVTTPYIQQALAMELYYPILSQKFEIHEKLGEGSFGEVRKAIDTFNGAVVAVKFVKMLAKSSGLPRAIFRELQALRQLCEAPNIVKLLEVFADEAHVCLVMEFCLSDIGQLIANSSTFFSIPEVKTICRMALSGIAACHAANVMHRDIKPSNFLIFRGGTVKLGDFGLARIFDNQVHSYSHQVSTRNYRAPELLFASRAYTEKVDIWSMAVVFAEVLGLKPLFPGSNDIDQIFKVFQVLGSPTLQSWPGVELLPDFSKVCFPSMEPLPLHAVIPNARAEDLEFLSCMLKLDPQQRISAAEALALPYFSTHPLPCYPSELSVLCAPQKKGGSIPQAKGIRSLEEYTRVVEDSAAI